MFAASIRMAKYWYLGARVKESSAASTGRIREHDIARWVPTLFNDAESAAKAAVDRMIKHPGVAYFIQGFDRKLVIDKDGYSHGFEQEAQ
jgi:hypothetical protein